VLVLYTVRTWFELQVVNCAVILLLYGNIKFRFPVVEKNYKEMIPEGNTHHNDKEEIREKHKNLNNRAN
jgi:hypothetical protein